MRRRLLWTAFGLAALAAKPRLAAQERSESAVEALERRLASIERVLTERSSAEATPAAAALHQRLERFEYRLQRLEARIASLRRGD